MDQSQIYQNGSQFNNGFAQAGSVPQNPNGQVVDATGGFAAQNQGNFAQQIPNNGFVQGNTGNTNQFGNQQKVFDEAMVNRIVQSRVNGKNTEISTLTAQKQQAEALAAQYLNELNQYKERDVLRKEGIPEYMYDFVAFEARKNAVNGKTFEVAVQEYKATNPVLFQNPNTNTQPDQIAGTAPNTGNNGSQVAANPVQGNVGGQQTGFVQGVYQASPTQGGMNNNGQVANQIPAPAQLPNNQNQMNPAYQQGFVQNQQVNQNPQVFSGSTGMNGITGGIAGGVAGASDVSAYIASRTKMK